MAKVSKGRGGTALGCSIGEGDARDVYALFSIRDREDGSVVTGQQRRWVMMPCCAVLVEWGDAIVGRRTSGGGLIASAVERSMVGGLTNRVR